MRNCNPRRTIALLGGSFNPAHAGHLHISREALKRLEVDEVWWLVSPQNPLKSTDGMAAYDTRYQKARTLAKADRRIHVSDIERQIGTRYSIDTVCALQQRYPQIRFIWLVGTDNFLNLHRWKQWEQLMHTIPLAVCNRLPYSHRALRGKAATRFAHNRIKERNFSKVFLLHPPCWTFLPIPPHSLSATFLRKTLGKKAFL